MKVGRIVWFTGLPGAGKSTLARGLAEALRAGGHVEVLDGDELRSTLSPELGFSKTDRDLNVRRIGFVARAIARSGATAIAAVVSPYAAARDEVRSLCVRDGIDFIEIFVSARLDTLLSRDPKGLYRRALAGEVKQVTGIDDPYEAPQHAELTIETDAETVERSVSTLVRWLSTR